LLLFSDTELMVSFKPEATAADEDEGTASTVVARPPAPDVAA